MSSRLSNIDGNTDTESVMLTRACADEAAGDAVDMATLNGFEEMWVEGEPDLIVELIDLYLESAPRQLAVVREAAEEGDEVALKRAAHNLKGSSATLGAVRVAALCEEIEVKGCVSLSVAGALASCLEEEFERARRSFAAERLRRL